MTGLRRKGGALPARREPLIRDVMSEPTDGQPRSKGQLRQCLGHFATGVTVVTIARQDGFHGATVNAFSSISLTPPLVMVSLARRSTICGSLSGAAFGVNILAAEQQELGHHFAGKRPGAQVRLGWAMHAQVPRIDGCVGFMACAPWASYDGGDHVIYLGEIQSLECRDGEPLIFHRGAFRALDRRWPGHAWDGSLDGPTAEAWRQDGSGDGDVVAHGAPAYVKT